MDKDQLSRKLAVILHADVVGSTSLVQQNETLAHERIQSAFHCFSKIIESYRGSARELRGDALVAEFSRASDAVVAALAFQLENAETNSARNEDMQVKLRVGISLGEVIVADNTITGAGVVLAQRLEQLAEPHGVVVQGSVSEIVPSRLPLEFESLGEQILKGFEQPVRAYSVKLQSNEILPPPEIALETLVGDQKSPRVLQKLSPESYEILTGERLELPEKPSLAVLPFQNMSDDPNQEFFADGMSEDIITALSRLPEMVVIARNSTFVYKGRAVDVREVGHELGVGYILEGSVRKSADRVRITAQLINTQTGDHLWAERYDRKIDDIFAVQDEITRNIVVEMRVSLGRGDVHRVAAASTKSFEAWELINRADRLTENYVRDDAMRAKQLARKALELDSNFPAAWAVLGWIFWEESVFKWSPDPEESMQMALEAAHKILSIDAQNPDGFTLLGNIHMVRGDQEKSIELCEKAVEISPSNAYSMALLANVLIDAGRLNEGIQRLKSAIRLCPFPPGWYFSLLGAAYHLNGDNETAIFSLEQAVQREPNVYYHRLWLTSALIEMGRIDEACANAKVVLDIEPKFSVVDWSESFKAKTHSRLKENLVAAGFPE